MEQRESGAERVDKKKLLQAVKMWSQSTLTIIYTAEEERKKS